MSLLRIVLFSVVVAAIYAIRCNIGTGPIDAQNNINAQPNLQECPYNVATCVKTIEWGPRTYNKGCGNSATNCTAFNGAINANPSCYNTSMGASLYCCCFGDGCNSAPTSSLFFAGAATIFSLAFF